MTEQPSGLATGAYRPPVWLPGPHLQTIVPSLRPGPRVGSSSEGMRVDVGQGSAVLLRVDRPPSARRGTLLLVHGMGGSADSSYMRRSARWALAHGWVTVRMNLRNCGGSERWSRTLYNAGQGDDVRDVLAELAATGSPRPFAVAGFSLGGNIVLLHAAISGQACLADSVVAVNPPVDLGGCADAIERPGNRVYRFRFVRELCRQVRRARAFRTVAGPEPVPRRIRTVRRFDDLFTAPDAGYRTAGEYYAAASAGPRLHRIRRPALILSAANDPFVPVEMFRPHHGAAGIRFLHPAEGGHCGYWQTGEPRFWAAGRILEFATSAGASPDRAKGPTS